MVVSHVAKKATYTVNIKSLFVQNRCTQNQETANLATNPSDIVSLSSPQRHKPKTSLVCDDSP